MEAQEDFSFQPINGGPTPINESPPLWGLPPKSTDHHEKEDRGYGNGGSWEKRTNGAHKKSNSCSGDSRRSNETVRDSDDEEDEKMDMLWEDFNEELLKNLSSRFGSRRLPELEYSESKEAKKEGGGRGGSRALLSARMAGVVVMMKVLKKLLFLHSLRRKLKGRTW